MIGVPFNDRECLTPTSQWLAHLVQEQDPVLVELASQHPTAASLSAHIRSLPQDDDLGDATERPRVHACAPPQRVQLNSPRPNCFERACLFVAVMELVDPESAYQLATIDTKLGLHTLPLMNGKPIILDPRLTDDCVDCGLALVAPGPVAVTPRNAIAWTTSMASEAAGELRNGDGSSTVFTGSNAIRRLVDRGAVPAATEIDAMAMLFALAERIARRYGDRAIAIVRATAHAIAQVLDAVLVHRNASFNIAGLKFNTPSWLDDTATAVGKVGWTWARYMREANSARWASVRTSWGSWRVGSARAGAPLGAFAHPPEMSTFAKVRRVTRRLILSDKSQSDLVVGESAHGALARSRPAWCRSPAAVTACRVPMARAVRGRRPRLARR